MMLLVFTALSFSSCSKDDDPVNNEFLQEPTKERFLIMMVVLPTSAQMTEVYL